MVSRCCRFTTTSRVVGATGVGLLRRLLRLADDVKSMRLTPGDNELFSAKIPSIRETHLAGTSENRDRSCGTVIQLGDVRYAKGKCLAQLLSGLIHRHR